MPNNDVTVESPMEPRLLKVEEAAVILQVPRSWLYAATKRGTFPCVRLGKYVRIRPEDVDAWIASGGSSEWTPSGDE